MSRPALSNLLNGNADLSGEMALRIEKAFGVSMDTLAAKLKPGSLEQLFERLPEITYWDFAGQLEYSAAHDFFLSSRQAVYVIVFSVVDDRDSQIHQVA